MASLSSFRHKSCATPRNCGVSLLYHHSPLQLNLSNTHSFFPVVATTTTYRLFFFFVLLIPLHQVDCVRFTPTAHFLLSDRFFKRLDREKKKPSSCLPRSSRTSLRRRRPRRRIRLVFSIIPCLFSVVFKGRRLTFIPLIDLWYEKRTYRKPPST